MMLTFFLAKREMQCPFFLRVSWCTVRLVGAEWHLQCVRPARPSALAAAAATATTTTRNGIIPGWFGFYGFLTFSVII